MNPNPYESPKVLAVQPSMPNEARAAALRSVRIALLIMLLPAVYNFICFSFPANANRIELPIHNVYRIIDSVGLLLTVLAIWFFGLAVLELVTCGIHSIVARKSTFDDWTAALYIILRRLPLFAVPGAALWTLWVAAFYQLQLGFYTVSVPIGIASHLLAAGLYVPLIYRWFTMERSSERQLHE